MKLHRIIIVSNVLVCFLLNNLLFTYSSEKEEKAKIVCTSEDQGCCSENEVGNVCCESNDCCANVPVSTHLNFSVIIGVDKKSEAALTAPSINTFHLKQINAAGELADGHLNSLIKPPAFA